MAQLNCTLVRQKYGINEYGYPETAVVGYNYQNDSDPYTYYPYILEFETPSFTGKPEKLHFVPKITQGSRNGAANTEVALRWAILSSDGNYANYWFAKGDVEDGNQLVCGSTVISGLTAGWTYPTVSVDASPLAANTTYYLILWGDDSGGYGQDYANLATVAEHSATLEYADTVTITEYHYGLKTDGGYELLEEETHTAACGEAFAPAVITGHTAYTSRDSTFSYWTGGKGEYLGGGTTGTDSFAVTGDHVVEVYYPVRTYTLSMAAGEGSSITVTRDGTALAGGATIRYGDVLTISFGASAGYDLGIHTVNDVSFTSGGTHTVTGAVAVVSTASLKTYALHISAGTGSTITVKKGTTVLADGATITHGDVLTISFGVKEGYSLTGHTVNGTAFTSGSTYTVAGVVAVAATAMVWAYPVGTGDGVELFHFYASNGNGVHRYVAYVGGENGVPVPLGTGG